LDVPDSSFPLAGCSFGAGGWTWDVPVCGWVADFPWSQQLDAVTGSGEKSNPAMSKAWNNVTMIISFLF
jgi:hypothetical protein